MEEKSLSYEEQLHKDIMEKVNKVKAEERIKTKQFFKKVLLLMSLLFVAGLLKYWAQYSAPWMEYQEEVLNYNTPNTTYVFENISLSSNEVYRIGFYFNNSDYIRKHAMQLKILDANYTVEYYEESKLVRTTKYNKNYRTLGFDAKQIDYHRMTFDEFKVPQDISGKNLTIKLIVDKPLDFLKVLEKNNEKVDFYIYKMPKDIVQIFEESEQRAKEGKYPMSYTDIPLSVNDHNASHIPFMKALIAKDLTTIQQIIEADNGIDVNSTLGHVKADMIRERKPQYRTPLIYAAYQNDVATLKYLIKKGADLNHKDYQRQNALGYAIQNGHVEAAQVLLDAGAKLEDVDYALIKKPIKQATSPLIAAVGNNDYEMTKFLLEHGAKHRLPSDDISHLGSDVYSYLYQIDDYKKILQLLLDYNVSSIGGSKPDADQLQKTYKHCEIYKGRIVPKGMDLCIPIVDRNISIDEMDIYIYYEMKYMSRKFQENLKKLNQSRKEN